MFVYLIWCLISIMSTFYIIEGDKNKRNTCELVKNVAQIEISAHTSLTIHIQSLLTTIFTLFIYYYIHISIFDIMVNRRYSNHLLVIHQWNDGTLASRSPNSIWSTSTMERWTDRKNVLYANILCVMCFFRLFFVENFYNSNFFYWLCLAFSPISG